MSYYISL